MVKVFIDPGHGGRDPGATAYGLQEKDVCLEIALKLADILKTSYDGHQIKLSRQTDQTVSLQTRTDMANNWAADYLISIHINAGGGTGFESYVYNGVSQHQADRDRHQKTIHSLVVEETELKNRGKKTANFHMLRESMMPAILTENGFIDTASDANLLTDDVFLETIAQGHAYGLAKAFGLERRATQETGVSDTGSSDEKLHIVAPSDTLWHIAQQYNTTVDTLLTLNHPIDPAHLRIGSSLIVHQGRNAGHFHKITQGDTLWDLSETYDTTVSQLLTLNPGIDVKRMVVGKQVRVR